MVVIAIIGILSALAYSSLVDLIFTNRAKETAQAMRAFAERALAEAKRQNAIVKLELKGSSMEATFGDEDDDDGDTDAAVDAAVNPSPQLKQFLSDGFSASPAEGFGIDFSEGITSQLLIGVSGITEEGYFAACSANGYCGAAVKKADDNSFRAFVRKGGGADWEAL